MKIVLVFLFLFFVGSDAYAQEPVFDSLRPDYEDIDYKNVKLPPVSVFIEAAQSYASVKYYDARKYEDEQALKISRKEWLNYIRLLGNYQYGTNSAYMLQSATNTPTDVQMMSENVQNWYNVGVAISIPLDDLFNRKNKNNIARSRVSQSDYERENILEERQLMILQSYNEVVKNLALLKVNAEAVALYDAQMHISERDFITGRIPIIDLSLERARRAEAIIKYQENRAELHNAVTILEMLTKIKIIR